MDVEGGFRVGLGLGLRDDKGGAKGWVNDGSLMKWIEIGEKQRNGLIHGILTS